MCRVYDGKLAISLMADNNAAVSPLPVVEHASHAHPLLLAS